MRMRVGLLLGMMVVCGAPVLAAEPNAGQACQDQLRMVTDLAVEYDRSRDTAVRDKVVYKRAFEDEQARRRALEKQLAELRAKLEPKEDVKE